MQNEKTQALSDRGVSIWLDDLSRARFGDGSLARLVATRNVVGVTTNPSIFQKAITAAGPYDAQIRELAEQNLAADEVVRKLTTDDVRRALDVFREIYDRTDGEDGRVSIEVDPRLAHDTDATVAQAKELFAEIDRPNLLVKIPATLEGLPAISATLAAGISVNVTLIFSIARYEQVIAAFMDGLKRAHANGHDLAKIHSVASFFVSRVDTAVDPELEKIGGGALKLCGKTAVANTKIAYEMFNEKFSGDDWADLERLGAHKQRPLWASTSVKNPAYPATLYVDGLAMKNVVNTMPEATLEAVASGSDPALLTDENPHEIIREVEKFGISLERVTDELEADGVAKFIAAWQDLLADVSKRLG